MVERGECVTFTAVAKAAGVSTWLVYAEGVREHIERARSRQAARSHRDNQAGLTASQSSMATDLELTRADNQRLRAELETLRETVRRQLGQQLDQLGAADLAERIEDLTRQNRSLRGELDELKGLYAGSQRQLAETEDDLSAARASLRRMIRNENRPLF
ncbi:hypothetical protein C7C46_01940 [Streptomyces tateyamensis]|uniref:Transposase n=2 Tax=Streptomyces tateyamensis TaxID=565073 RepID=A0A2V4PP38_9ACTN|nr:hypothetical protein C7C46_01940 [Streptomyces tateyamensis]